ncbi:MAG: amidohydrolase family protein [Chitinophagaceae bacterium]|nr:amidohydrolase family protein [Chitinophagaceae bacterium]MCW5925663.1 amidohydrolase family protein [Chitinophagaceae bacterium]
MKKILLICSFIITGAVIFAQQPPRKVPPEQYILFQNVKIFSGKSNALSGNMNVLIRDNKIEKISAVAIPVDGKANITIINGSGKTLMPGLIDVHAHLQFWNLPIVTMATADPHYLQIRASAYVKDMLMAGFTSARDLSGSVFGMKRAIDEGLVVGPRIWPSGPMISQTSGHADFRNLVDLPAKANPYPAPGVRQGLNAIADGVAEMHQVVREQLMQGASQIKLAAGGGVSSNYDPVDVTEYTKEEIEAAVADAENWGTYVTVHAYTPRAVRMAIDAGVKCIEHGQLLNEATIKYMKEKDIWLSLQPFLMDEDAIPTAPGSDNEAKYKLVVAGTDSAYIWAKKYGVKTAFGTDIQLNTIGTTRQPFYLPKLVKWYTPAETLTMATADNAKLLALSGPRNPYPGKLGVIEEGAYADILLVNGDPLANIKLLEDPAKNLLVIMKDGKIYKNLTQ